MSSQKKPPEDELHNGFLRHALAIGPRRPFLLSGGTFREIQTIRHLLIVIAASASAVSRLSIRIGSRRAARTTTPLGHVYGYAPAYGGAGSRGFLVSGGKEILAFQTDPGAMVAARLTSDGR